MQDTFNALLEDLNEINVYDEDLKPIEKKLSDFKNKAAENIRESKNFIETTQKTYTKEQNIVPSDISQELVALELLAERLQGAMDDKENEIKRARTVRTEYLTAVDEIRTWIQKTEVKINDRTLEPIKLREILGELSQEIENAYEKLESAKANGRVIIENSRSLNEKELVENTLDQLTQQLSQVRTWLDERKQLADDSLDAWTRFLNLYQIVMTWVAEKKNFLNEPLTLSTLPECREKFDSYSHAVKSIKPIVKHLSEMDKDLDRIIQVTAADSLKVKLQQAEEAKVSVEAVLLQRVGGAFFSTRHNILDGHIFHCISGIISLFFSFCSIANSSMPCCKKRLKNGINVRRKSKIFEFGSTRPKHY